MYRSLEKVCKDFHLYVFAFDDACYNFFASQKLSHLTVVSLKEFEDPELLRVKPTRTAGEYCWTCSSSTILYSIETFGLSNCTYIDADMYFYSDPRALVDEMGDSSVLITEHRYTPEYDQSAHNGRYCVQFVTFKNDERGMKVLRWWRDACIEWCYGRIEDGKFGDQKYLDTWTVDFAGVHELQHLGGGLAPWNMQQYTFQKKSDGTIAGREIKSGKSFQAVFFHFHGLRFYSDHIVSLTGNDYEMNDSAMELFFTPYVKDLLRVKKELESKLPGVNVDGATAEAPQKPLTFGSLFKDYLRDCRRSVLNSFGKSIRYKLRHHHFYHTSDFE